MSISSITSSPSYSNPATQAQPVQSSSQQQPAQLPGTGSQDPEDTVHLPQGAQIDQMAQQGESPSEIASTTGLSPSEVDSDLGISTTSSSVTVAAPSGHGGEHRAAAAPASAGPASAGPAPPAAAPAATASAATSESNTATPAPTLSVRA
jgi:hypothetical protein